MPARVARPHEPRATSSPLRDCRRPRNCSLHGGHRAPPRTTVPRLSSCWGADRRRGRQQHDAVHFPARTYCPLGMVVRRSGLISTSDPVPTRDCWRHGHADRYGSTIRPTARGRQGDRSVAGSRLRAARFERSRGVDRVSTLGGCSRSHGADPLIPRDTWPRAPATAARCQRRLPSSGARTGSHRRPLLRSARAVERRGPLTPSLSAAAACLLHRCHGRSRAVRSGDLALRPSSHGPKALQSLS